MSLSREHILQEIQRTAQANGGKPLGRLSFFTETGIKEADWRGRFWARWNDVLKDAGFGPNKLTEAREDDVLLERYAMLAMELGRLPVNSELRLKKRSDFSFPNDKTFARFGTKAQFLLRFRKYCADKPNYNEVLNLFGEECVEDEPMADSSQQLTESTDGFVYLVKMGKHYKIGKTFSIPRRHREIALALPEELKPVHVIRTDDPSGIEAYWHRRFQAKNTNGEWFSLSADDVRIFKKRKFM
jgi:hypothetical protein